MCIRDRLSLVTAGIFSSLSPHFELLGNVLFVGNNAVFYGGAISLTDPIEFHIIGTRFESNTGTSGGAVSVAATRATTGGFKRCRFDGNVAVNGGALFLSADDTGVLDNARGVQGSVFVHNTAGERSSTYCMV